VKLLLDTHIAVWVVSDDRRLTPDARNLISNPTNEKVVSVVSLWEIGLKRAGNPERIPFSAADAEQAFEAAGFSVLPVSAAQALTFETVRERHGDPFDRMLVAQALSEPLRLVTHDRAVARYSDTFFLV
jgi:PIN domain nuclease of toxin-antitoxin system